MTDMEVFRKVFDDKIRLEQENKELRKHVKRLLDAFLIDTPTASARRKKASNYMRQLGEQV